MYNVLACRLITRFATIVYECHDVIGRVVINVC